jgi:hypothetical protein
MHTYGFVADPTKTASHNASIYMQGMPFWFYLSRPTNSACHNLCVKQQPPANYRSLLGLGLKFIPKPKYTQSHEINKSLARLQRDLYVKIFMAHTPTLVPRLYISTDWVPPLRMVNYNLQERVNNFNRRVILQYSRRKTRSNMLPHQRRILADFRTNKTHIIMSADKNLGPCVIERERYILRALQDHLLDTTTYKSLHLIQATQHIDFIRNKLKNFVNYYKNKLEATDIKYLTNTMQVKDPYPKFYITAKVHKNPWKTRPIVSVSGSLLDGLGRFVDKLLQPYFKTIPSAVRNSMYLKDTLMALDVLPPTARFFTADATSMYTNIHTNHALPLITRFLQTQPMLISTHERAAAIEGLDMIMRHNIFQFGDTYWLQINGTAMGVSPSCTYATLYFAVHESDFIRTFPELHYYKRYIDDVIGIWIPRSIDDNQRWALFQTTMNNFGKLRWEFSSRLHTINFLDLTINIDKHGKINTKIYEKPENLYLYLPATSSHPYSNLKGLIHGMVYRTIRLTSSREDQSRELQNLVRRLTARGYQQSFLTNIINQTYLRIKTPKPQQNIEKEIEEKCFFHTYYHPDDPPSSAIQTIFQEELLSPIHMWKKLPDLLNHRKARLRVNRLTVAYHRTSNLGNLLSPRLLRNSDGPRVSSYI